MSDPQPPWHDPQPPNPRQSGGCGTVFIIFIGVIMLLPGLCAVLTTPLVFETRQDGRFNLDTAAIWLMSLAVGAAGIALIVREIRRMAR